MHNNGYAIALGMFDGMHIGHRALVKSTVAFAKEYGCKSMVYTFENHPLAVLGRDPGTLMSVEERTDVMKMLGIDEVVMLPFSREFAAIQPEDFLKNLVDRYHMCAAFAGFNYTFGDKGRGDEPLLRKYGAEHGFHVSVLPPVLYDGNPVSSTRVRYAILEGDMLTAAALLGEPYFLSGMLEKDCEEEYFFRMHRMKILPTQGSYRVQLCGEDFTCEASASIKPETIRVRIQTELDTAASVRMKILERIQ